MSTQQPPQPPPPPTNKKERVFELPVAWLLGRQLVASLKSTLLYTAYGPKLEARDWMVAKVFPSDDQKTADEAWGNADEFWFDYIADSGDGMKATYSIAYLCMKEIPLKDLGSKEMLTLPRGEFLFVGGDTTYHLADYATLHNRFHTPFNWAHEDLLSAGLVDRIRRPIFGIPGNHDYYDMLDGFRRQFRLPFPSTPDNQAYPPGVGPQLRLDGFRRVQEASYVALRLPFGWMMWGLDTEVGKIDERQRDFFKNVNGGQIPDKLIVATSAPTTVFGKYADRDDDKCAKAFFQLGLPRPFLPDEKPGDETGKTEEEPQLQPHQIRLDLSGDVHQYARYWGPDPVLKEKTRANAKKKPDSTPNYASVVSGLGGAFLHPSTTYVDEVNEQVLYPSEEKSRNAVTDQLFSAIEVARGGNVWLIGAILAATLAFAAIASDSSRPAINNFGIFTWLGITQSVQYNSTVHLEKRQQENREKAGFGNTAWDPKFPENQDCVTTEPKYLWGKCRVERPAEYLWGMTILVLTIIPIGLALALTARYYGRSETQQEVKEGALKAQAEEEKPKRSENEKIVKKVSITLWSTTLITIILVVIGLLAVLPYRAYITPFGNSLLVLTTLIWAGVAVYLSIRYSDWLFQQAAKRRIRSRDWFITWVQTGAAAASVAIGLWVFGKHNLPAYLISDIVFVALLLATLILIPLLAITLGGAHQKPLGKWLGMGLVGLWHWLLQLGVALFLIMKGTWLTVILAVGVFIIFKLIGKPQMRANRRWGLLTAWLVFGAIMLALPPVVYEVLIRETFTLPQGFLDAAFYPYAFADVPRSFAAYEWWANFGGWKELFPISLAAIFGAVLSCMWLGWYFAVCLGFNGHNNEVGGAARIESFKQFIRFRITAEGITGYVIAVDDVSMIGEEVAGQARKKDGEYLHPRLIDVFQLKVK